MRLPRPRRADAVRFVAAFLAAAAVALAAAPSAAPEAAPPPAAHAARAAEAAERAAAALEQWRDGRQSFVDARATALAGRATAEDAASALTAQGADPSLVAAAHGAASTLDRAARCADARDAAACEPLAADLRTAAEALRASV